MHKKDIIVRDLRRFHGRFYSITDLKVRLMEELEESIPQTIKFAVGYFVQSTKYWICNEEDLKAMYTSGDNHITLLCDGREEPDTDCTPSRGSKRRKKSEEHGTKREEKEQCV